MYFSLIPDFQLSSLVFNSKTDSNVLVSLGEHSLSANIAHLFNYFMFLNGYIELPFFIIHILKVFKINTQLTSNTISIFLN